MNRQENEGDTYYLQRLTKHRNFNKTVFKRYLMEDCLHSLESIKNLNNEHINKVIELIEKWLKDPTSVTAKQFQKSIANADAYAIPAIHAASVGGIESSHWAANAATLVYVVCFPGQKRENKLKQYLRFAKKLVYKPNFPQNFVNCLLNSQTEEELNVWIIDYAQKKILPSLENYLEFLYETEYNSSLVLQNEELAALLAPIV